MANMSANFNEQSRLAFLGKVNQFIALNPKFKMDGEPALAFEQKDNPKSPVISIRCAIKAAGGQSVLITYDSQGVRLEKSNDVGVQVCTTVNDGFTALNKWAKDVSALAGSSASRQSQPSGTDKPA